MEQDSTWLRTSLFCKKNNWGILLEEIDSFINKWSGSPFLNAYLIEFNYLSGENIRFTVLTPIEHANFFAKHIDLFFKDAFLRSSLFRNNPMPPVDSVFMTFPENTIQYGLYESYDTDELIDVNKYSFTTNLSGLIIKALKKEEINDELIMTFGIYLSLVLIKALIADRPALVEKLIIFYSNSGNGCNAKLDSMPLANNKELLSQIIIDIFGFHQESKAPDWLQKWREVCEKLIAINIMRYPDNDLIIIFTRIIQIIYRHINISGKMEFLLSCLIRQVFLIQNNLLLQPSQPSVP